MIQRSFVPLLLGLAATVAHGQSARVVRYHANDIVAVRARMRYTTLIELPSSEKIMEVATGDKDYWIIDAVGNYCFLHPAKEGIHSNLNLITDKGTVYSFTLDDIETGEPDLKVVIEPSDPSALAAATGGLGRLRIDDGHRRGSVPPARSAALFAQDPGHAFPSSRQRKLLVHAQPGRKVRRQLTPLAVGLDHVEKGVYHTAQLILAGPSSGMAAAAITPQ